MEQILKQIQALKNKMVKKNIIGKLSFMLNNFIELSNDLTNLEQTIINENKENKEAD